MKLLTSQQAAESIGVSVRTLHDICRKGDIDHIQLTPKIRAFKPEHVQNFIERNTKSKFQPGKLLENRTILLPVVIQKKRAPNAAQNLASLKEEMKKW